MFFIFFSQPSSIRLRMYSSPYHFHIFLFWAVLIQANSIMSPKHFIWGVPRVRFPNHGLRSRICTFHLPSVCQGWYAANCHLRMWSNLPNHHPGQILLLISLSWVFFPRLSFWLSYVYSFTCSSLFQPKAILISFSVFVIIFVFIRLVLPTLSSFSVYV